MMEMEAIRKNKIGNRIWVQNTQKDIMEEIKIPPMPEDFMPKQRSIRGARPKYDDEYHRVTREAQRLLYWRRKWRIYYIKQLLRDKGSLVDKILRKKIEKQEATQ